MTIVVGIDSLTEAIVISDSRVSWENKRYPPQDFLRKLYTINGPDNKSAVLGFSGNLHAASLIMRFLMEKKLRHYKRPLVMSHLKDDLGRWIEEVAKKEMPIEKRTKVKIMLCGIEASRHPPIVKDGKVIGYMPFIEVHVYVYSINNRCTVSYNALPKGFSVIGKGQQLEREIVKRVQETVTFGFKQPNLHWARAVVMGETIATIMSDDTKLSETVGGPFQVIRITSDGLESHYIWPPRKGDRNVKVRHDKETTIVSNPSTGQKYVLYPVWQLTSGQLSGTG